MFFRQFKHFFNPMDTKIPNSTLEEYRKVRDRSIAAFLLIIQAIYLNQPSFVDVFKDHDLADYIMGLVLSGSLYSILYAVFRFLHQYFWIWRNFSTCYISGIWYHVFDRQIDNDKEFVRAGWIRISQNFYDLDVEAYNYNVTLENGVLKCDEQKRSHWHFSLSELETNGRIKACFSKATKNNELISDDGIINLFLDKDDSDKRIDKMYGIFSDSAPSQTKGNIKLFRMPPDKKNDNFNFIACAPMEWKEYIEEQINRSVKK